MGTMIKGTITKGLNRSKNTKHSPRRPTASFQIRRKAKDSRKPNPRPMYTVRPLRAPSNPWGNLRLARGPPAGTLDKRLTFPLRSRVVSLPSRERTPPRSRVGSLPSGDRIVSASLEAIPRRKGQTALPLARLPYRGIKYQPLLRSARVRWRQATTPHSGCDQGLIRQLRSLLRSSPTLWRHCGNLRRCAKRARHYSNHCADNSLHFPCTLPSVEPSNGMGTALGSGPDLDQDRIHACRTVGAPPRHATPGRQYPLQQRPRRPLELPGRRRNLRKAKDDAQDDCHARRHTPQYTFYSARPLHPRDSGRR